MGVKLLEHVWNAALDEVTVTSLPFLCCERKRAETAVTCRHWQGDEVRGKRGLRRSGYAKMSLQAKHGTVEEYEPVETHLRVEMSPLPTPLDRQDVDCRRAHVLSGDTNAVWTRRPGSREPREARS